MKTFISIRLPGDIAACVKSLTLKLITVNSPTTRTGSSSYREFGTNNLK